MITNEFIVFDTETTGLVKAESSRLSEQPQIIEFAAIKLDNEFNELNRITFLCNPGKPLPPKIIEITGLHDSDLKDKEPFVANYPKISEFFLGTRCLVAHNISFDTSLLKFELMRIDRVLRFPWPPIWIDTIERSMGFEGRRLKLVELYKMATGKEYAAHRALADVEALIVTMKWMKESKGITF